MGITDPTADIYSVGFSVQILVIAVTSHPDPYCRTFTSSRPIYYWPTTRGNEATKVNLKGYSSGIWLCRPLGTVAARLAVGWAMEVVCSSSPLLASYHKNRM